MKYLFVIVICIFLYECYWPVPDYDKERFKKYKHIPVKDVQLKAELIYFEIGTPEQCKNYLAHRPNLNTNEKKIIEKYKKWLNENH